MIYTDEEIETFKKIWRALYSKADYAHLCYLLQVEE